MKPTVKFLTVVWGKSYIKRFCSLSLPSFVAPGNLPHLASSTDLEVVIMTSQKDFGEFEQFTAFRRLQSFCSVRFVSIDDLLFPTNIYGVTLTLAYARPIIACGDEMVNIHFLFMNADFILADGSLKKVASHITNGRRIILGPSFRATSERLEPLLEARVNQQTGVLAVPPRELVSLALAHPHPTTIAKTQNQTLLHSRYPNQFFWRINSKTILGHYYLIFMLALKPERVIRGVNSYCDYGLVPELCPSGDEVAMGDSDDFFMLELQERDKEEHFLSFGVQSRENLHRSLSEWTTKEHRRSAHHPILFHSEDPPDNLQSYEETAQQLVQQLNRNIGKPQSHAFHKYWRSGVVAWLTDGNLQAKGIWPPELQKPPRFSPMWLALGAERLSAFLRHSGSWANYFFLKKCVYDAMKCPERTLLVGQFSPIMENLISQSVSKDWSKVNLASSPLKLHKSPPDFSNASSTGFSSINIFLREINPSFLKTVINWAVASMREEGNLVIVVHLDRPATFSLGILDLLDGLEGRIASAEIQSIGGDLAWKSRHLGTFLCYALRGKRWPIRLIRTFAIFPYVLFNLLILISPSQGKPRPALVKRWQSLMIKVRLSTPQVPSLSEANPMKISRIHARHKCVST